MGEASFEEVLPESLAYFGSPMFIFSLPNRGPRIDFLLAVLTGVPFLRGSLHLLYALCLLLRVFCSVLFSFPSSLPLYI